MRFEFGQQVKGHQGNATVNTSILIVQINPIIFSLSPFTNFFTMALTCLVTIFSFANASKTEILCWLCIALIKQ